MLVINRIFQLVAFICLVRPTWARRSLLATSLVTCMDNSQISPSYFNVTFNPDDRSLKYSLDLTTEISGNVVADIQVFAYGFVIIRKTVNMCTLGWKQFCPVFPGSMQVESVEYISESYVKEIPGIAYLVPDIDAVVRVIVRDSNSGEQLSCLQSAFSNGKTVSQTGAKWATAVIAGLGLLIAAILSTFGNSNAASHISANSVSLFLYFQSVVVVCMQLVERVPPIASAWSENLAWSMGLIRVQFMQDIFRWYIQLTGGTPTLYFTGTTKQILVQRALKYLDGLHKRAIDFGLSSNASLSILRGIKRIGFNSKIEPTSIVVTGFTFFIIIGYILVVLLVLLKSVIELLIRFNKISSSKFQSFRNSFKIILKGSVLRYIYIGCTQLIILSLWEFVQQDSPAVIVLAVLFLILPLSVIGWSFYKTVHFARLSISKFNNPAALLYGDSNILNKYGFCYTMFQANKYWFGIVLVGYNLLKSIFIGLCQGSGKTSVVVLFVADLAYTIFLIFHAPYLNKSTNVVNYMIAIVTTINSFLFLFFSDLFGQTASVGSIMGWVFFVLNAAFSLILLILIIVFIVMSLVSKNPDARFAPAKDDRSSFQRKSSIKYPQYNVEGKEIQSNNELAALGIAAQDHSTNWESQMYDLNKLSSNENSASRSNITNDHLTPNIRQQEKFVDETSSIGDNDSSSIPGENNSQSLGAKLKNLTRGFSIRSKHNVEDAVDLPSNKVSPAKSGKITRISDTIPYQDTDELSPITGNANQGLSGHNRENSAISTNSIHNGPVNAQGVL